MRLARKFADDRRGVAAIEVALILPVLAVIVAATLDFGAILYTRFKLDESVASAANYAMVNSANVNSTSGSALATAMATLVATTHGSAWADSSVVVNAGPQESDTSGMLSPSGSDSPADSCYCPSGTAGSVTWGSAHTCGATCTGGGVAGKFVQITASRAYTPMFAGFGVVRNSTIQSSSLVQVQ